MTINQRMFEEMKKKKVKNIDIANSLNINKTVVSAWKARGTNPPAEYIVQICELLQVSPYFLLTGKETENLSSEEQQLLAAYRITDPGTKNSVRKLLDLPTESTGKSSDLMTG